MSEKWITRQQWQRGPRYLELHEDLLQYENCFRLVLGNEASNREVRLPLPLEAHSRADLAREYAAEIAEVLGLNARTFYIHEHVRYAVEAADGSQAEQRFCESKRPWDEFDGTLIERTIEEEGA